MGNLAQRIQKESLGQELTTYQENYRDVFRQYNREQNPARKNGMKDQLDEYLDRINKIEKEIKELDNCQIEEIITELINILNDSWEQYTNNIIQAYYLSLPNRRIVKTNQPDNVEEIIKILLEYSENNNCVYFVERFVGYLLLDGKLSVEFIVRLRTWATNNIENHHLDNYNRELDHNPTFEQLKFRDEVIISTDSRLSNLPDIVKEFIKQIFNKCQRYIQQIHIFLPSHLINHNVDCWYNWQEQEDEDYATTIGEDYEVIIRFSERLRGKDPVVYKWHKKGDIFRDNLEKPAIEILTLGDQNSLKDLFKKVKLDHVKAVKITNVFQKKELGKPLYKAGIPLALWIRQKFDNITEELDSLLQDNEQDLLLKNLPYQVKIKRGNDDEVSEHLCLLWDDPNLLPPESFLKGLN